MLLPVRRSVLVDGRRALIGPVVAIVSFVCSVGNVPLAAVRWNGGISFGGVIAFLFADLIVLPYDRDHRFIIIATPLFEAQ